MQELQERAVSSRGFPTKTRVESKAECKNYKKEQLAAEDFLPRQELRGRQSARTTRKSS